MAYLIFMFSDNISSGLLDSQCLLKYLTKSGILVCNVYYQYLIVGKGRGLRELWEKALRTLALVNLIDVGKREHHHHLWLISHRYSVWSSVVFSRRAASCLITIYVGGFCGNAVAVSFTAAVR